MKVILTLAILLLSTFASAETEPVTVENGQYVFNVLAITECETKAELVAVLETVYKVIPELTDTLALEAFLSVAEVHAEKLK